ncbi:MAG TPA: hypothetical protein VK158_02885 [Acidobacteriota bacterium]|nr:hypothetical protein [Acidobacteriota bacterium]
MKKLFLSPFLLYVQPLIYVIILLFINLNRSTAILALASFCIFFATPAFCANQIILIWILRNSTLTKKKLLMINTLCHILLLIAFATAVIIRWNSLPDNVAVLKL